MNASTKYSYTKLGKYCRRGDGLRAREFAEIVSSINVRSYRLLPIDCCQCDCLNMS